MASYLERLHGADRRRAVEHRHQFDDHEDMPKINRKRLHTVDHLMTPETNLDVQTRIITAADAFVGTYGGFSYLAPLCGTDTLAFYSHVTGFASTIWNWRSGSSQDSGKAPSSSSTSGRPICFGWGSGEPFVKILFIARHFTYIRNFEIGRRGVCRARARRLPCRRCRRRRSVDARWSIGLPPRFPIASPWPGRRRRATIATRALAASLRLGLDYLRYSDPRYEATPKIRERARSRTPMTIVALSRLRLPRRDHPRPRPARGGRCLVRKTSTSSLRSSDPIVVLITPLVELGSPQLDYVRAARRLGIPSAFCVGSWDHLSSKALIRVVPDAVIVWNETQRLEGRQVSRHPVESRDRDGCAMLRPVVRSGTRAESSGVLHANGTAAGSAVRPVGVLGAFPGKSVGIGIRPRIGSMRSGVRLIRVSVMLES